MADSIPIGYCTNVHAGRSWVEMRDNLARYATGVRARLDGAAPLGVGLWFSAASAREILDGDAVGDLRAWLDEQGLYALTFNGFPHGDFHGPVVKHAVYTPTWAQRARLEYTCDLIDIAAGLMAEGQALSISTLPLGWQGVDVGRAAGYLLEAVQRLQDVEHHSGRFIHLDLEPEPGCCLQRAADVVAFFERHLLVEGRREQAARYLGVCHDICHQAVMFEDHERVLAAYRAAGIGVGKVQISSALRVPFGDLPRGARAGALRQLASFQEDRYLHQTVVQTPGEGTRFFEDLPLAVRELGGAEPQGEWRVHFHVPLVWEGSGALRTTRHTIAPCLAALQRYPGPRDHEVETYTWDVLPESLRTADLAAGIAAEVAWARAVFAGEVRP